jgi:hypothetical protein
MLIIGCDFHTRYQQIAMLDQSTGSWSSGSYRGAPSRLRNVTYVM